MRNNHFDVVITGAGSMGASASYYLSSRGAKVLTLEQFSEIPHDHGSHAGQSRIIRKAYFEDPAYVPLLEKAYHNWHELEQLTGEQLFYPTGLLYYGPPEHPVIKGIKYASEKFGIEITQIDLKDQKEKFPYRCFEHNTAMLLEPEAGFLLPGKSIRSYLDHASKHNALIKTGEKLLSWQASPNEVKIFTDKGSYTASKLVITAGAWINKLLNGALPLRITRQLIAWIELEQPAEFSYEKFPCWMIAGNEFNGVYYGFPYLSGEKFPGHEGLKFAWHHASAETDPDSVDRQVTETEIEDLVKRVSFYFPAVKAKVNAHQTCLYTNTPDEHFIIDFFPEANDRVIVASPCSGHGFKFASVIGEILADLALEGKSKLDIDFLKLGRFS